jgi:HK97 family phage portal protein
MINTLASLALDSGVDILAAPEKRFVDVPKESDIYRGLTSYGQTDTGLSINEQNALSYMPVLACTRVISETLAMLPLKVFREGESGPEAAKSHYLYQILYAQPNPEMTSFNFWEAAGVSLCLYNHFYAQIEWNQAGRVKALWPLLPNRVTLRRVGSRLVYDYITDDGLETLDSVDVLHVPGCLNLTGVATESLIRWAREAIGLGLAPQKYAANFYKNNARPGMYLTTTQALSPAYRETLRQGWNDIHAGISGAGKTGVLEGGLEIKIPSVPQKDAEFSVTREFQLQEVCRVYRVPLHMVGDLSRSTNNNIEHQGLEFSKFTMAPYCRRIEQVINMRLLGINSGYYSEFNMAAIERGDLLSRTQAYALAINTAQMMPNEARAKENRAAVDGGDKLYIQGANVPLEMAGKHLDQQQQGEGNEEN